MALIKVFDNFLSKKDAEYVTDYCLSSKYSYGEKDNFDTPAVGMVSEISEKSNVYKLFQNLINSSITEIKEYNLYRAYINCFAPSENPYFHKDGDTGLTLLYYPNKKWDHNDNGETQILLNNQIVGVLPIPNRLLLFEANLVHRATSFRDKHRFTIALKYN